MQETGRCFQTIIKVVAQEALNFPHNLQSSNHKALQNMVIFQSKHCVSSGCSHSLAVRAVRRYLFEE
jgi:hypothetical protein